jgi:hypothetical protein
MPYFVTPGPDAFRRTVRNRASRWEKVADRVGSAFYRPLLSPKFQLDRQSKVFAMGSCFAQEVQQELIWLGVDVRSWIYDDATSRKYLMEHADGDEPRYFPMHFFHRFNLKSMGQEIGNLLGVPNFTLGDKLLIADDNGTVRDYHYQPGFPAESMDFAMERRAYVRQQLGGIKDCDLFVMTLGLTETWIDKQQGVYANTEYPFRSVSADRDRFEFGVLGTKECHDTLEQCVHLIHQHNPKAKIVLTVSPIPLNTTFSPNDVAVATSRSKATLIATANEVSAKYDYVDYFPSYEIVSLSDRDAVWREDKRHIRTEFVRQIMRLFVETYFPEEQSVRVAAE